jgi:soluble lytic murein transglycosylase-like protein
MDVISTILNAAKSAKVAGALFLAICSHESRNFRANYTPDDNGSASYGVCQLKFNSAVQLGFKGTQEQLKNPKINIKYAALYLRYEQDRYGEDWVKLTSAYNAGSYVESTKKPGCPKNLKYIRLVQLKLPEELKDRLSCGDT